MFHILIYFQILTGKFGWILLMKILISIIQYLTSNAFSPLNHSKILHLVLLSFLCAYFLFSY